MNIIKIMTVAAIASTTMFSTAFALTNNTQEKDVSENNSISEKSSSIELEVDFSKDRETKLVNPKGIEEEVEVNDVEEDITEDAVLVADAEYQTEVEYDYYIEEDFSEDAVLVADGEYQYEGEYDFYVEEDFTGDEVIVDPNIEYQYEAEYDFYVEEDFAGGEIIDDFDVEYQY